MTGRAGRVVAGRGRIGPATRATPAPTATPDASRRPTWPTRHQGRQGSAEVGVPEVLDLLAAAARSGAPVQRAVDAVGLACGGRRGTALRAVAAALGWGAGWAEAWAAAPDELRPVAHALHPAWQDGSPPAGPLLAAAAVLRRERQAEALEAAERLAVRLVVPLGLCHLPSFVLFGVVPVVLALVGAQLGG